MHVQAICVSASGSQFAIHNQSTCSIDNTHYIHNSEGHFLKFSVFGNGNDKSESRHKKLCQNHHHNLTAIHCLHKPIL